MIEISETLLNVTSVIIVVTFCIIMADWVLSGKFAIGEYMDYRKLPNWFPMVFLIYTVIAGIAIGTILVLNADLLSACISSWTIQIKIVK